MKANRRKESVVCKNYFDSGGVRFHLFGLYDFADIYYGVSAKNVTDSYLLDCITAEMQEFNPNTVIWTTDPTRENMYVYFNPNKATYMDVRHAVLDMIDSLLDGEESLREADAWTENVTNNLLILTDNRNRDGILQQV